MKKALFLSVVSVMTLVLGVILTNTPVANAQVVCPPGFICTPITTTTNYLTILNPQAGGVFDNSGAKDALMTISWSGIGIDKDSSVGIVLLSSTGSQIKYIANGVTTGSYVWPNDPTLPNGTYAIEVYQDNIKGGGLQAISGYFQIVNSPAGGSSSGGGGGGTACYTWSTNLGVGSRGPDVVALQTWLMANGYNIYSIALGNASKGYFGESTAAAVVKLQTAAGLPSTGYVGSLTRAYLNANACNGNGTTVSGTGIVASLDPASPITSMVQISTSAVTQNVPIAIFDLKSQGTKSSLKSLTLGMPVYSPNLKQSPSLYTGSLFTNVFIRVAGMTYAETSSNGSSVTFSNLNVPLPADANVPITVLVSVAQDTNNFLDGSNVSANLPLSGVSAVDSSGNPVQVNQGGIVGLLSGSTITFSGAAGGTQVSNVSASLGTLACSVPTTICYQPVSFSFTLTAGNSPIYFGTYADSASNASLFFAGKDGNAVPSKGGIIANPASMAGDGSNYFYIAPGASRQFTFSGTVNQNGIVQVIAIQYGTNTTNLTSNSITYGLDNLRLVVSLPGSTIPTPITPQPPLTPYTSSDQIVTFSKNFFVSQSGSPVTLTMAADNKFSVSVNGTTVSTNNSETNFYSSQNIDLTPAIQQGTNKLAITIDNMVNPQTTGTAWLNNPAGLDYKITQNGMTLASSDGSEQSSVSSTVVIPYNKILGTWTTIPGASWIWDSSYYNAAQTAIAPCPTGYNCPTTQSIPVAIVDNSTYSPGGAFVSLSIKGYPTNNQVDHWVLGYTCAAGVVLDTGKSLLCNGTDTGKSGLTYYRYNIYNVSNDYLMITASVLNKNSYSSSLYFTLDARDSSDRSIGTPDYKTITISGASIQQPTGQPPVISGGTFPTSLNVGQQGTWTVNASDPQNGSLSYSVNWGDSCPAGYTCAVSAATPIFTQSSSFTHTYSNAGTYTVMFTVKNSAGLTAQTSSTVSVGAPVCPAGYSCVLPGQTVTCPAGYTCTNQTTDNCPSGYTCYTQSQTQVTKPIPTPVPVQVAPTTVNATVSYSCPSGYQLSGTDVGSCIAPPDLMPAQPDGTCSVSGYTAHVTSTGTICSYQIYRPSPTVPASPSYSCPAGYTLSGSTCTSPTSMNQSGSMSASIWNAIKAYFGN